MHNLLRVIIIIMPVLFLSCVERPLEVTSPGSGDGYSSTTAGGVTFKWKVDGSNLDCVMSSNGDGWVAVGFASAAAAQKSGANIIIGYVDSGGTAYIKDDFADSGTTHQADTTQNVTLISGTNTGGKTEIKFTIPLNSGDANDVVLTSGNSYYILLAYSNSADDFTTYHDDRGYAQINL